MRIYYVYEGDDDGGLGRVYFLTPIAGTRARILHFLKLKPTKVPRYWPSSWAGGDWTSCAVTRNEGRAAVEVNDSPLWNEPSTGGSLLVNNTGMMDNLTDDQLFVYDEPRRLDEERGFRGRVAPV